MLGEDFSAGAAELRALLVQPPGARDVSGTAPTSQPREQTGISSLRGLRALAQRFGDVQRCSPEQGEGSEVLQVHPGLRGGKVP